MVTWSWWGIWPQASMNISYTKWVSSTFLKYFSGIRSLCLVEQSGEILNNSTQKSMSLVASFTTSQVYGPLTSCFPILSMECRRFLCEPDLWYVLINLLMLSSIKDKLRRVNELAGMLRISYFIY